MALTLIRHHEIWDQDRWMRGLVGKRLCHTCISQNIRRIQAGQASERTELIGTVLFLGSLLAILIAWALKLEPIVIVGGVLFLLSIVVFFSGAAAKPTADRLRRSRLKKLSPILVSTESLFDVSDDEEEAVTNNTRDALPSDASQDSPPN